MATSPREYLVYADGSCIGNPGRGGWGVVVRDPDGVVTELNGHDDTTTNNRMELMGAIEGLRATAPGASVILRSDSQYVVKTMNDGWKRKANLDLWELLDAETAARQRAIRMGARTRHRRDQQPRRRTGAQWCERQADRQRRIASASSRS